MAGGIALDGAAVVVIACIGRRAWPVAAPFVILWMVSPAIARWASLSPAMAGANPLSDTDARALRLIARRTWRFFETFVTANDHMLAAGQLPGRTAAGVSPSDFPYQPRTVPAVGGRRLRFRLAG